MMVPLSFHRFGCKLILQCFSSKYLFCFALWMLPAKIPSAIFHWPTSPHQSFSYVFFSALSLKFDKPKMNA